MSKKTKAYNIITATPKELQDLLDLGYTYADAGRLWGVTRAAVQQFAKRNGISKRNSGPIVPPELLKSHAKNLTEG